jgi:hypothetical protein
MGLNIQRDAVIAHIVASVETRAAEIRRLADATVPQLLEHYGVTSCNNSNILMNDVAYNCSKDLEKIAIYQKDSVDQLKTFGYFGFWIRKIKPIEQAAKGSSPFKEVNEYLSVWVIGSLVTRHCKLMAKKDPSRRAEAAASIYAIEKLINDSKRLEYLVHCMRSRTFGPHHYVILLQQTIGCAKLQQQF